MAKKKNRKKTKQPELSRKHITRAQKQAEARQRLIMISSATGIAVVLILVLGLLYAIFVEPSQAMAEINQEEISRSEFYQRVNYERFQTANIIADSREQALEMLEGDPQTARMFMQYFQQQIGQLQAAYSAIGSQTLEQMIEEHLLEDKASERDITVSDDEVSEEIRRTIARQEGALIEVDVEATATSRAAATATALLFTPTPTLEPSPIPTDTLDSEVEPTPVADTGPTQTPAPTATPNILSDTLYDEAYMAFLTELEDRVGYTDSDYREVTRLRLLRNKMQELIGNEAEVETTGPYVHAAHILVETQEEANAAIERINGGEAFADVAAELSSDGSAENGGDLGWFGEGQMVPVFEETAFALTEVGQLSEPVESQFGWHVITLLEPQEERDLPETQIEQARNDAFTEYLSELKSNSNIRRYWDLDDLPRDPFIDEIAEPLPTLPPLAEPTAPELPEIEVVPDEESDSTTEEDSGSTEAEE